MDSQINGNPPRKGGLGPVETPSILDTRGLVHPEDYSIRPDGSWRPAREGLRKRASVSGYVPFPHLKRSVWFESGLELDCLKALKTFGDQVGVLGQPVKLNTKQLGFGRWRYTPDFLVWLIGPRGQYIDPVLVEVKYEQDLTRNWEEIHTRVLAGLRFARRQGWRFAFITDRHLREAPPQRIAWTSEATPGHLRRDPRVVFTHLFPRWKEAVS